MITAFFASIWLLVALLAFAATKRGQPTGRPSALRTTTEADTLKARLNLH